MGARVAAVVMLCAGVALADDAGVPWVTHRLAPAKLELEFPAGEVHQALWDTGGGTLYQDLREAGDALRLSVRAEKAEGLDAFRSDHTEWKLGAQTALRVCGQPAVRLTASRAAQHITCVMTAEGDHPAYIPASRATVVVFAWKGLVVRLTAESESDRPGAHDAAMRRFLASVRCL